MAINFLNTVDLNFNQLNKAAIQNLGTDPAAGVLGQIYYNTAISALKICITASTGAANAVWQEVGATSGVETISIGNANVNSGGVNTGLVRTPGTGIGDIVITPAIYGGAANVGMVPTGGSAGKYLDGAGNWLDVTTGDITAVLPGTYINIDNQTGPTPTVNHDLTTRSNTTSSASPGYGVSFTAIDSVTTNTTGHVTAVNTKTVTIPASDNTNTTYTLPVTNGNNPDIVLTGSNPSSTDIVNMNGVNTTVKVTGSGTNTLTFDLVDDVTIISDLTVGDNLTLTGGNLSVTGTGSFTGQVTIPTTPSGNDKAASKLYVDQSNIGQSVFQGGYNAATNTPDLDTNPATTIKKGFFWAVTDTGDFFTEEVQPGDLIYANQDNPGATFGNWVVVQSGQDIAKAGATDGATVKGIAGFNSAHFNVTSNGWVSSDIYSGGSNLGIVPSGGTNTKFLRGDGSFEVPDYVTYSAMNTATLGLGRLRYALGSTPAANSQSTTAGRTYGVTKNASDQLIVNVPWVNTSAVTSVSSSADNDLLGIEVSPTTGAVKVGLDINGLTAISTLADADTLPIYDGGTNKKISLLQLENHIGAAKSKRFILNATGILNVSQQASPPGGTIGWVVDLNASLGITDALNCMVEIIQTSNGRTVYAEVTRTGTGASSKVTINFSTPVSQGAYQALITRIY